MAQHEDPAVSFHFSIDIEGVVTGYFTECSGLGSAHEKIEHKVMTEDGKEVVMKVPGRLSWEDITLKRGITSNMDIWDWRKQVEDGEVEEARRNGTITMFNQQLKPVARWNFERAWPLKVSGPQPRTDSNEIAVEELIITHEYIERVKA